MPDDGTQESVYLPDVACQRVEFAADRGRQARPGCDDELSLGGRGWGDETEVAFGTGAPWERLVDLDVDGRL
jgi:hypothetical protein